MTCLAEAHTIGFVIKELAPLVLQSKNPKVTQEGLTWISNSLEEFHLPASVSVKALIDLTKSALDQTNPTVRTAATKLACCLRKFVGPSLVDFYGDLKGPKLVALEKEFSKVSQISGEPKRYSREEPKKESGSNKNAPASSLLPREDLSSKISPTIIQHLSDGSLKEKKSALEEIEQVINGCHKRITPNLPSELLNILKSRLSDSTALLVISTLGIFFLYILLLF